MPTFAEQQSITGKTADTPWATSGLTAKREVYNGVNGAWFGPGLDGNTGTTNILTQVFLPLMGYRTNAGGAITSISEQVYYYSSNISSLTDAFCFGFSSTNARMCIGYARSTGRAVRCVWK